jgi:tetratricopeptide (TPR) repeat protein
MKAGRSLDGQLCCQQALAVDPNHAGTLHLMGLLSIQHQQYDHALEWVARALRQEADLAYFLSLGTVLQLQGRHDETLRLAWISMEADSPNMCVAKGFTRLTNCGRAIRPIGALIRAHRSATSPRRTRKSHET